MALQAEITADEAGEIVPADTLFSVLRAEGSGVVVGRVTDGSRPLANALVELTGVATQARTNDRGEFRLSGIPSGSHSLYVRSLGYQSRVEPIVVATEVRDTLVLSLEAAPHTLEVVQVIGSRSRNAMALEEVHRRTQLGMTRLVSSDHIQRFGLTSALRMQPFVYWLGEGTNRFIAFRRMGRFCLPNIMVDGVAVPRGMVNTPDGTGFDLDFWVPVEQIAAVEYVRGQASFASFMRTSNGEMGIDPGGECGTIAIWRK